MNDTLDLLTSTTREQRPTPPARRREYHPTSEQSQDIIEHLYAAGSSESSPETDLQPAALPPAYDEEIVANEASDLAISVRDGDEAGIRDAGNALGAAIAAALLEVYDGLISEE